jgi:hypothetical protein
MIYLSERTLLCLLHYNSRNDVFRTDIIDLRIACTEKNSCVGMTLVVQNAEDVKYGKRYEWQLNVNKQLKCEVLKIESFVNRSLQALFDCVNVNDYFVGYSDVTRRKLIIIMYME